MSEPLSDFGGDKDRVAKLAADTWNVITDEPAVEGLEAPIDVGEIKVTRCHGPLKHGHILGTSHGIKLGVNPEWWAKQRDERLLVFLAHEYAHLTDESNGPDQGKHKPRFWEKHMEHVKDVLMGVDRIEAVGSIDPHHLTEDLRGSVNTSIVDRRCMSCEECRSMIEDRFTYLL